MPNFEVKVVPGILEVKYSDFNSEWISPVNAIVVAIEAIRTGETIWERIVADRFIRTGLPREWSYDKRLNRTIDRADKLAAKLNHD